MTATYKLSQYHVATEPFVDGKTGGRAKRIVFGARKATARVVDGQLFDRVQSGDMAEKDLPVEALSELLDAEILVPADEDEVRTIFDKNDRAVQTEKTLYLVLQPTGWCQLGCWYCGQEHRRATLSPENQDRLIEHVRRHLQTGDYENVEICWFGGEPLAGMRVVRRLTPRLRQLAEEHNCTYSAGVVSNGVTLTRKVAEELVRKLSVRKIEVTLDGTAEYHDTRRPMKSGAATFQRIFDNVVDLAGRDDLDVKLTVRCNVDQGNRDGVTPLLRMLAEAGVHRRITGFYVSPVFDWGNEAGQQGVSREEFARWELEWFMEMFKLGYELPLIPQRQPIPCMTYKPDAQLVDPFGVLHKCSETPLVPAYEQPAEPGRLPVFESTSCGSNSPCHNAAQDNRCAIGDLIEGARPERCEFFGFNDRARRGEYACGTCRLLPVCGGYCPKKWHDGDIPCPATRYNIEQRLLLAYAAGRLTAEPGAGLGTRYNASWQVAEAGEE